MLNSAEKVLLLDIAQKQENTSDALILLDVCGALKAAKYDLEIISLIAKKVWSRNPLPGFFSIVNNRFLCIPGAPIYNLDKCCEEEPQERKRLALVIWLPTREDYESNSTEQDLELGSEAEHRV